MNKTIVALRKKLVVAPDDGMDNRREVATVQANLMHYGYMLSEDAFRQLSKADLSYITSWYKDALTFIKTVTGGDVVGEPLYRNFPKEVMSLSDFELYLNAIMHYWSRGAWEPRTPVLEKPIAFEKVKYIMLEAGTSEQFNNIFTTLVSINTSLTPTDLEVVKWFVQANGVEGVQLIFPESIPFKENLCTLAAMGLDVPVKTPTDVLRIIVHMSGGDISLPKVPSAKVNTKVSKGMRRFTIEKVDNAERKKFRFKKFSRAERKYILSLLEKTHCRPAEMILKGNRWVRIGEILHPGEYKSQFPKAYEAFRAIRGGEKGNKTKRPISWYGQVDKAFKRSFAEGVEMLAQRPGEFMRRLDFLVRTNQTMYIERTVPKRRVPSNRRPSSNILVADAVQTRPRSTNTEENLQAIYMALGAAAKGSSNKVLFELYSHLQNRLEGVKNRSIFIKGARKRTPLPDLPPLKEHIVNDLSRIIFATLKEKFAALPPIGTCWIDEQLKNVPVPANMRSMNDGQRPTVRGTRIPFDNPDAKVIRPFVHWIGPVDLDLSVTFVGRTAEVLSFSNLRVGQSVHSGDVRGRSGKCAEYIDISIADARARGAKYALIDVRNFDGGSLSKHQAVFGLMEREHPESNLTWLPSTISNCQSLKASGQSTVIGILDLETLEYIMLDIESTGRTAYGNVPELLKLIDQYATPPKFSVYDLLQMHVEARGKNTLLENAPETLFKFEDFAFSYEKTATFMI